MPGGARNTKTPTSKRPCKQIPQSERMWGNKVKERGT
jgi:hypothetical protein